MNFVRFRPLRVILACSLLMAAGVALPAAADAPANTALLDQIKDYHNELKDMSAQFKVEHENNEALSHISPDFAQFVKYGFRTFKYYFKNPDKVRIESSATLFHFLHGVDARDGGMKNFYIPALHIHKTANVTGQANKMETALDFGVMAGDIWDNYRIWYVGSSSSAGAGKSLIVLGMRPTNEPHGGTMQVFLDPVTLAVVERDRSNGDGVLQQREIFSNYVHPLPHVYIPTDVKLYNNEGQFGGELVYTNVTVNTGLADSFFK